MKLKKELVDKLIRIYKKYYRTGDVDILPAVREAENELEQNDKAAWDLVCLIGDLAKFTQYSGKGTYDDIYRALAIFGVIVEWVSLKQE